MRSLTPDYIPLKHYLEEHKDDILKDIQYIVESDSPSLDKNLLDRCSERIQELFIKYFGYPAEVIEMEQYGNHLKFEYGQGEEYILILSHFDTVWDKDELTFKIEENKAYGPGILDMKGGLVQAIWAIKSCKDLQLPLKKKIIFLCTSDEEIGSPSSRDIIEQLAKKASVVLVTEPPVSGTGALKTARKGGSRYFIDIQGKAAHSGNHHEDGVSAIKEAASITLFLESLTDYTKGTTVNVGLFKGGGKLNVVPDKATIGVDVRASSYEEQKRIDEIINTIEPSTKGISIKVDGEINRPPMIRTNETAKLFYTAKEIGESLGIQLEEASVGGGSDGNFTAALGVPTLDGLGAYGKGIHERHEHILIDEIPIRTALFCGLLLNL